MKSTDRQIHLILHFIKARAEQDAACLQQSHVSPRGPSARHTQHTNVITLLPHFCRAAGVGHEGDHALRTIRRHTHRDWETM